MVTEFIDCWQFRVGQLREKILTDITGRNDQEEDANPHELLAVYSVGDCFLNSTNLTN